MEGFTTRMKSACAQHAMLGLAMCAMLASGCTSGGVPRIDPSGRYVLIFPEADPQVAQVPPAAAPNFVANNFVANRAAPNSPAPNSPAAEPTIKLSSEQLVAPVGGEVVIVAGVASPDGKRIANRRVEWTLSRESVGQFVTIEDRGGANATQLPAGAPRRIDNQLAVGSTAPSRVTITRGTPTPDDDVSIERGEAWISVSSSSEGTTQLTAYDPAVSEWQRRKASSTIHWVDAQWLFPPPATNPVGTPHTLTTSVTRQTDGTPIEGWLVRYELLGGPPAGFGPDAAKVVEVATDRLGRAQTTITVHDAEAKAGTSRIGVQVIRPADAKAGDQKRLILASGVTTKTWTAHKLALQASGPAEARVGATAVYRIKVSNASDLPSRDVVVAEAVPEGCAYRSSEPEAQSNDRRLEWQLGTLAPRESRTIEVRLRAERAGPVNHVAMAHAGGGVKAQDCAITLAGSTVAQTAASPLHAAEKAEPRLEMRIAGPETAAVGDTVRFEVTVSNVGDTPVEGLTISDQFDEGLKHLVSASPIERDLGDLAAGDVERVVIAFRVTKPGRLCHVVQLNDDSGLLDTQQACLTATPNQDTPEESARPSQPIPDAAIRVKLAGPNESRAGETVMFQVKVANAGPIAISNLRVAATYDTALVIERADRGFEQDRQQDEIVWMLDHLEPGERREWQVECRCTAPGRACGRVEVTSDEGTPTADETCIVVLPGPQGRNALSASSASTLQGGLRMEMIARDRKVQLGGVARFQIVLTNPQQTSDREVQLTVTLPPELRPMQQGTRSPQVRPTFDGQTIRFEPIAEIRAGESQLVYEIQARAVQPGKARAVAELESRGLDRPLSAEAETEVGGR